MSDVQDPRQPAFDPFGEPMISARPRVGISARPCAGVKAEHRGYGETRRVAIVFWALALLFVIGRIYFAEGPSAGTFAAGAAPVMDAQIMDAQVATLR